MAKKKEENATVNTQEIKTKFQQKMGELLEIAKKKRNILEYQEISDHFKELNLDAEQFEADRKSTRLNSSHRSQSRMPSSA